MLTALEELYVADNGLTSMKQEEYTPKMFFLLNLNQYQSWCPTVQPTEAWKGTTCKPSRLPTTRLLTFQVAPLPSLSGECTYLWCFTGLEHMTNLEEFWANNNGVEDFKEVKRILQINNWKCHLGCVQGV